MRRNAWLAWLVVCAATASCARSLPHAGDDAGVVDASVALDASRDAGLSPTADAHFACDPDPASLSITPGCAGRLVIDCRAIDVCAATSFSADVLTLGTDPSVILEYWPNAFDPGTTLTGCGATSSAFIDIHVTWPGESGPNVYQSGGSDDCTLGSNVHVETNVMSHDTALRHVSLTLVGNAVETSTNTARSLTARFDTMY